MIRSKPKFLIALAFGAIAWAAACSDSGTTGLKPSGSSQGTLIVRLTDAPFPTDSVKSVDIWVVRLDARTADVNDAAADSALSDDSSSAQGWKTVASPNALFDLLSLQNGISAVLGQADLPPGTFDGFRLIIDPSKSSVTLKDGRVLSGSTTPGIDFPSASHSGIKIVLSQPVQIIAGTTTMLLVDFKVDDSFVMRGNSIEKNGLLFKPVIKATVTNLALTNASVRLVNATDTTLNFLQNGSPLSGSSNIPFGAGSACASVNAATPELSVTQGNSSTPLPGLAPLLVAGHGFSIVAYRDTTGVVHFATLPDTFTAAPGQAGLRAFNASGGATALDVFVTALTAPLGAPTFADLPSGADSPFENIVADTLRIRATATGTTTPLVLDLDTRLSAGQTSNLIIAPHASGKTAIRGFIIGGC